LALPAAPALLDSRSHPRILRRKLQYLSILDAIAMKSPVFALSAALALAVAPAFAAADPAESSGLPGLGAAPAANWAGLTLGGFGGANFLANKTLGLGGLQAGYSYQVGRFVFGPRIDAFWRPYSSNSFDQWTPSTSIWQRGWPVGQISQFQAANHFSANFFSTVVGRFGYEVTGNFLPYVTAGLIMGGASMDTTVAGSISGWGGGTTWLGMYGSVLGVLPRGYGNGRDLPPRRGSGASVFGANSLDQTRTGLTAGGGFEYGLTRNWSLQLDYKYFAFPMMTLHTPAFANGVQVTSFTLWNKGWGNILSLGANYHF
jgi:opacity protein-like surface antigen